MEHMNENVELYLKSFDIIPTYDLKKELDPKRVAGFKRTRDVKYENYVKAPKTSDEPSSFVVFDLETTGLSATNNEIIEIGAIRFVNDEAREQFHTYIKPKRKITQKITDITGITNEMVKDAPTIEDVLPYFVDFIKDDVLVAHNSSFDMGFILHNLFINNYKKIKNKTIDTLQLSRRRVRELDSDNIPRRLQNYKLVTLKEHYGLNEVGSHNAIDDCKVCAYVYLRIKNDEVIEEIEEVAGVGEVKIALNPQPQLDIKQQRLEQQKELLEQKRIERKEASEKLRQTQENFKKGIPTEADRKKSIKTLQRDLMLMKFAKIITFIICIMSLLLMIVNVFIGLIFLLIGIVGFKVNSHTALRIENAIKEKNNR